jgi:hypothetical protein
VWVPNWSSTSCGLGIFVYQSTEPIATSDAKLGRRRGGWERLERRCLVQCSVRSMGVEVRYVFGQHGPKLALVEDEHPIQQLAAHGADPSFGDGVCPGCPYRGARDAEGFAGDDRVEHVGERGVSVADREKAPG